MWKVNWRAEDDTLAELELAGNRVYLQNYYNEGWANNFMMHSKCGRRTGVVGACFEGDRGGWLWGCTGAGAAGAVL